MTQEQHDIIVKCRDIVQKMYDKTAKVKPQKVQLGETLTKLEQLINEPIHKPIKEPYYKPVDDPFKPEYYYV